MHFIGLGPGDPSLLSLKAAAIIPKLDLIFVPEKLGQPSLARQILMPLFKQHPKLHDRLVAVPLDMKLDRAQINKAYDAAAQQMDAAIGDGQKVGYVCEGDPMLYGSAIYLVDRLKHKTNIEIIPGISSITAVAAAAQLPLVRGDHILSILPATLPDEKLGAALDHCDVAVFLKAGRHVERLKMLLERRKFVENAYLVTKASQGVETISALSDTLNAPLHYFTTLCAIRPGLQWTYPQ